MRVITPTLARVLTCLFALYGPPEAWAATPIKTSMQSVYEAIAYLLPRSVEALDGLPENNAAWKQPEIEAQLKTLTDASGALLKHTGAGGAEPSVLTRSPERLVQDTAVSFREHWPAYAYYSLFELTAQCVACHSQSRVREQRDIGRRLMASMKAPALTPGARALLLMATGDFDTALTLLEQQLLDAKTDPVGADQRGLPVQYLRISILTSAGGDMGRVKQFVDSYRQRTDMPEALQQRYAHWRQALTRLTSSVEGTPNLRRATQIFEHATRLTPAPGNPLAAVEYFVAARLLRTILQIQTMQNPVETAEIYYKLGIIALRTSEPKPAVPEMEALFAATIMAAPAGPRAREAYSLLETHGHIGNEALASQNRSAVLLDMQALKKSIVQTATP